MRKYFVFYPLFWLGYLYFLLTSKTPKLSYYSFRQLFCLTNGKLNDFMASRAKKTKPAYSIKKTEGVLGKLSADEIKTISQRIKDDGFYFFEKKLDKDICDKLKEFALNTPANVIPSPEENGDSFIYDRENLFGTRYQFTEYDLMQNRSVQDLVADETFFAIAQEYFQSKPLNDSVTMWWSTPYSKEASSEAAQLFHFDMDRFKFLKFFVYLTDVTTNTGPHCYVKGTHKNLPEKFLKDGRIPDAEILKYYNKNDIMEFTGDVGTILAVDTRGLHKGKPLVSGERLLFQIEYTTSFFGQDYNTIEVTQPTSQFSRVAEKFKYTFQRFRLA